MAYQMGGGCDTSLGREVNELAEGCGPHATASVLTETCADQVHRRNSVSTSRTCKSLPLDFGVHSQCSQCALLYLDQVFLSNAEKAAVRIKTASSLRRPDIEPHMCRRTAPYRLQVLEVLSLSTCQHSRSYVLLLLQKGR